MKPQLSMDNLIKEAGLFAQVESSHFDRAIYGITDGKAIGTYFEHKFQTHLAARYNYEQGSSASGIDFPGLGYSLLVFVYEKTDDPATEMGRLSIVNTVFVDQCRTADFQTTVGIQQILQNDGNTDDLVGFMEDRRLPVDDIQAQKLAQEILQNPPETGYLTISNALQWRLQYRRVIENAGNVDGILRIR